MGPFRFRLKRVLDWRSEQCQVEQNRLAGFYAALAAKRAELEQLLADQQAIERRLLGAASISAGELQALDEYRRACKLTELRLKQEMTRCEHDIQAQIGVLKTARLRVHLLEKLQERRLTEHTYALNRELEELAADTYLAKFAREL